MLLGVFLDSGPVGLITQRPGKSAEADACRLWAENLIQQNVRLYIPEIVDYEIRRELIRAGKTQSVARLEYWNSTAHYLTITTSTMRLASQLWAHARNQGVPTAADHALDADVILAAQVLNTRLPLPEIFVATTNVRHISRFVPADVWSNITP